MKISEVTKDDMKFFGQLINTLQIAEVTVTGKDACALADSLRWFQKLATLGAKAFSDNASPVASEAPVIKEDKPAEPVEKPAPAGGLPSGVKIKAFHPGKPGKSK